MNPPTRSTGARGIVGTIIVTGLFLAGAFTAWSNSRAIETAKRNSGAMLLAVAEATPREAAKPLKSAQYVAALRARPTDAMTVNAALYSRIISRGEPYRYSQSELALLSRLGWRHTPALQNRAIAAIQMRDVRAILDISDALLRRAQLVPDVTQLMNLAETDPQGRKMLAAKLALKPVWRTDYLKATAGLRSPKQIAARGELAAAMMRSKAGLTREEMLPTLKLLVAGGETDRAYEIWRVSRKVPAAPISDPDFAWAFANLRADEQDMPFEWQQASGTGYWTELTQQKPGYEMTIRWDGEGVPEFLTQQTHGTGGLRQLEIGGANLSRATLDRFSFAFRCPKGSVAFREVVSASAKRLVLRSEQPAPCDSPVFVVEGRPRQFGSRMPEELGLADADAIELRLTSIRLTGGPSRPAAPGS